MARVEGLTRAAQVKGMLPDRPVPIVDVQWNGSAVVGVLTRCFGSFLVYAAMLTELIGLRCGFERRAELVRP